MIRLLLRPLLLSKEIEVKCPRCKRVVSHGKALVFCHENDVPTGFIPDVNRKHCRLCVVGPMLFDDMQSATVFIRKLKAKGPDYPVPVSPLSDLELALRTIGTNIVQMRAFVTQTLQHRHPFT
ncbi:MAG: hypothetical protein RLZZ67_585 [Candidatus Parcubacteria bacterium]|jgi:hypothetical protein